VLGYSLRREAYEMSAPNQFLMKLCFGMERLASD